MNDDEKNKYPKPWICDDPEGWDFQRTPRRRLRVEHEQRTRDHAEYISKHFREKLKGWEEHYKKHHFCDDDDVGNYGRLWEKKINLMEICVRIIAEGSSYHWPNEEESKVILEKIDEEFQERMKVE